MSRWWVLSFLAQYSFKKLTEIPNYCLFPTLCTVVLDLGALIFYFK